MSMLLTRFLPIKNTTTNITNQSLLSGQALFETDKKHRLFLDYADSEYGFNTLKRYTIIDCNIPLKSFSTIHSMNDNMGYDSLSLKDNDDELTYIEVPHSRYSVDSMSINSEGIIPIFSFSCSKEMNENYDLFIQPFLVAEGGIVTDSTLGTTDNGMCFTIQPSRITLTEGQYYNTLDLIYPTFYSEVYGIEIPTGGSITLKCFIYDKANYDGCHVWW